MQAIITRIQQMEQYFEDTADTMRHCPEKIYEDEEIQEKLQMLVDYQESGQWLKDYEADERGELPADLKRGVLSQDGLYNLLNEVDDYEKRKDAEKIMMERFGKDSIIALATTVDNVPYVRSVNAFYQDGAFYVLTYGLSNKMKQIEKNSTVAIAGDWFTAHGKGVNLGYFGKTENAPIAKKMKEEFAEWIDNGHNNFEDENTCILCIELLDGILLSHGTRYEIDYSK